jgi:hypothetical protein
MLPHPRVSFSEMLYVLLRDVDEPVHSTVTLYADRRHCKGCLLALVAICSLLHNSLTVQVATMLPPAGLRLTREPSRV